MKVRFFNPGSSYLRHRNEYLENIDRVLTNGDLILRDDVSTFEKRMAEYLGVKYFVALNSCTDALYLALRALKVGPGDEVLVPSRTFVASAQVIVQVGATPVYYDLDGELKITDKTKAIIPVHIEGEMDKNFDSIFMKATEHDLYVIEDAAQALGAVYMGRMAGSMGTAGCFSFYPAKILGAYGDAGGLATNDEAMYEYVKGARNHFKEDARDWGVNSRLDNLQAAILNIKLDELSDNLNTRRVIAIKYSDELLGEVLDGKLELPPHTEGRVWQDYIVRCRSKEERDALFTFLKENGVETMKNNYPFPVPKLPLAQKYEDETLRLPCNQELTMEEVDYVISKIKEFYK